MHRPDPKHSDSQIPAPASIAETLAKAAALSDQAILVGNRAGLVEWANIGWTRITGFPLSETIAKPITDFLDEAKIEVDLVDFVGQNFLEARPSTLEFPFDTFDGRSIWVRLEVQPIRNAEGEVSEFVATASDITERHRLESQPIDARATSETSAEANTPRDIVAPGDSTHISLSEEVEKVCGILLRDAGARTHVDLDLAPKLPSTEADPLILAEVVRLMVSAALSEADESWGMVAIMTGRTMPARSHRSAAYPVPLRDPLLESESHLFLEVHDTAPALEPSLAESISKGLPNNVPRARALATATALARALGGRLFVDSMPGCGTQAVLLLPIR